jgi:hypothetical protein
LNGTTCVYPAPGSFPTSVKFVDENPTFGSIEGLLTFTAAVGDVDYHQIYLLNHDETIVQDLGRVVMPLANFTLSTITRSDLTQGLSLPLVQYAYQFAPTLFVFQFLFQPPPFFLFFFLFFFPPRAAVQMIAVVPGNTLGGQAWSRAAKYYLLDNDDGLLDGLTWTRVSYSPPGPQAGQVRNLGQIKKKKRIKNRENEVCFV